MNPTTPQPTDGAIIAEYTKQIINDNGMVKAAVYRNGTQVDWEWFFFPFFTRRFRFKQAHRWADKLIEQCELYERPALGKGGA